MSWEVKGYDGVEYSYQNNDIDVGINYRNPDDSFDKGDAR